MRRLARARLAGVVACAALFACSRGADKPAAAGAPSGKTNAFIGNYGYLVTYPLDDTAQARWGDKEKTDEIVDFFPGRAAPENSEAPGFVRLEAVPVNDPSGKPVPLDAILNGMGATMRGYGETFTVAGATATLPGMKVAIVNPKTPGKLYQVVLRGKYVVYMFSSRDEALADAFGAALTEIQPTDRPGR